MSDQSVTAPLSSSEPPRTVLRATELREKEFDDLVALAGRLGIDLPDEISKESLVQKIVHSTYPIAKLPKVRAASRRGVIVRAYVDEVGTPVPDGTNVVELKKRLMETFGMSEEDAHVNVSLYQRDLIRYYGYDLVENDGVTVKLTDDRRLQWLPDNRTE